MRFEEARAQGRPGVSAAFPYLLHALKALNIVLGYLLIAKIAGSWFNLPLGLFLLAAIFIVSFAGFFFLDRAFKRDSYSKSEYLVHTGTLLFFGFIWLMFGR
ncbi:MAG: hypothetical protein AB1468_06405 [Candidatus Micrarchaeota archaeon]